MRWELPTWRQTGMLFAGLVTLLATVNPQRVLAAGEATPPAITTGADVVYLDGGQDSTLQFGKQAYQGLLARELFRQAFLLAAREELSAVTHDRHLGQLPPQGASQRLDLVLVAAQPNRIEILVGEPPRQALFAQERLAVGDEPDLVALAQQAEALSRGNFVRQLQAAGVKGEPRRWNDLAELPAEITELLDQMSFITQWQAACLLHSHIAREGQSPAAYGALVRAYANLGVLTELHWQATNKVFKARALLYAERLVNSGRTPSLALEARAYARLLTGFPLAATADLEAAAKLPAERIAGSAKLEPLLRAFLALDQARLTPLKQPAALRETTLLLGYLAREFTLNSAEHLAAAEATSEALPHCYRVNSYLAHEPDLRVGHSATSECFELTASTLYPRLAQIAELPAPLQRAVDEGTKAEEDEFSARGKLIAALKIAHQPIGEQYELTWPVLGNLIGDHSFGEVMRRTRFLRYKLASSPDAWITAAEPLFAGHPYAMLMELLRFNGDDEKFKAASAQAYRVDIDFLELGAHHFMYSPGIHASRQTRVENQIDRHMDFTATDQARMVNKYFHDESQAALRLFALWPAAPIARNAMIKRHWRVVKQDLPKWERWMAENPELLTALGTSLFREKQYQEAADVLEKACKLAPSHEAYTELAFCYQQLKQDDNWLRTLQGALKLEDRGLEHARLNTQIANFYRRQRDYAGALPYAEAAAESYSEWGLRLAAEVHEALRHFDEAEKYYQAISERYNKLDWYKFTRRRYSDNVAAATAFSKQMLIEELGSRANPFAVVQFSIMTDDQRQVVKTVEPLVKQYPLESGLQLFLALAHDELGQTKERDAVLTAAFKGDGKWTTEQLRDVLLYDLVLLLLKDVQSGAKAAFTPVDIEAARKAASKDDNGKFMFEFLLGRYLELHGKPEEAKKLYFRAWAQEPNENLNRHLSGHRLQKLGVNLSEHKTAFEKELEAPLKPKEKAEEKK